MKFKVALRKKSNALSFRKSIEQVRLKKLKKLILALMVESELSEGADEKEDINLMLEALVAKYLSITVADDEGLEKCSQINRTIDSFSASDCKIFFEFKKVDLWRLLPLLNFPENAYLTMIVTCLTRRCS